MSKDQLRPCPFCGGSGIELLVREVASTDALGNARISYYVECQYCGTQTGWCSLRSYAIEDWNTRPAEDALRAVIELLANMKDPAEIGALICEARKIIGEKTK